MLDFKFIRDNLEAVKENIAHRGMSADADKVVRLYEQRNEALAKLDDLRRQRNENAGKMKGKLDPDVRQNLIEEGRQLKQKIAAEEASSEQIFKDLQEEGSRIPNMAHPDAPVGKEEKDNTVALQVGDVPEFDFEPKDHVQLGEAMDLVDFETATRVSGSKFYYLKNEAVLLELALTRFAMEVLREKGFTITQTPDLARVDIAEGIGFNPRG